jgi:hypothetical protein
LRQTNKKTRKYGKDLLLKIAVVEGEERLA